MHESILFALIIGECNIINPAITTIISSDGHMLTITNIPEEDMAKLVFPTNTDNNNNKLTLINVSVSLEVNPTKEVIVPGLTQQLVYAFNNSNSRGFRSLDILHRPFAKMEAASFSPYQSTLTTPELTDILTGITTFTQPTSGKRKQYTLVLTNGGVSPIGGGTCANNNKNCPSGYPICGANGLCYSN
jgi:hypothetical protein